MYSWNVEHGMIYETEEWAMVDSEKGNIVLRLYTYTLWYF